MQVWDRYDRTTGGPYDGNEWRKYCVVPRAHPSRPRVYACFYSAGHGDPLRKRDREGHVENVRQKGMAMPGIMPYPTA